MSMTVGPRAGPPGPLRAALWLAAGLWFCSGAVMAAPDEDALGRAAGYPAARTQAQAFQEAYLVGSFSAMDTLAPHCNLPPAIEPLPLKTAAVEPPLRYRFDGRSLGLDDYMQRQRSTALLVLQDGEIVAERYNYARTGDMRMLSNSMAKTLVALAVGKALEDGLIRSLDDSVATYVPALAGTLYGDSRIRHLLQMASGAKFVEDYSGVDDHARFNRTMRQRGAAQAARGVTERAAPAGERFNYASAETQMLGLLLRAATGRTLCDYVAEKIWQPMGAQARATWLVNPLDGTEYAAGNFNATPRDYARLGWLLANDGAPPGGRRVIGADYLMDMTDASRQAEAFRPGRMPHKGSSYLGYGRQVWLMPGTHRRFVLLGIHGQAIMVDPDLKLVVVHLAVTRKASGEDAFAKERDALFRGIVGHYGKW